MQTNSLEGLMNAIASLKRKNKASFSLLQTNKIALTAKPLSGVHSMLMLTMRWLRLFILKISWMKRSLPTTKPLA
jgi:hypothetical protein